MVQARYTNDVTQALMCYTGIGPGWSFDVEQISTNKTRMFTRTAFFPIPGGMAEASFTTPKANYKDQRIRFANLLSSLTVAPASPSALRQPQPARSQEISR